jgi:hypothetical protein
VITNPTADDIDRLAKQWLVADRYVREQCGGDRLQQTVGDLQFLQRVLDAQVIAPTQTFELQCLGVALGRVLAANVEGLEWAIVDDEYGRDPTIRYRGTTLQLNVLTMISKRVEQGERVDIQQMYGGLCGKVRALKDEVD